MDDTDADDPRPAEADGGSRRSEAHWDDRPTDDEVARPSPLAASESGLASRDYRPRTAGPELVTSWSLGPAPSADGPDDADWRVERGEYDSYEEGLDDWADNPLDRIGDPIELGDTVAFLSSPRSGYVNGQAIVIDGGGGSSNL